MSWAIHICSLARLIRNLPVRSPNAAAMSSPWVNVWNTTWTGPRGGVWTLVDLKWENAHVQEIWVRQQDATATEDADVEGQGEGDEGSQAAASGSAASAATKDVDVEGQGEGDEANEASDAAATEDVDVEGNEGSQAAASGSASATAEPPAKKPRQLSYEGDDDVNPPPPPYSK